MARFLITYHTGDMPQDPESIAQARRAFVQWAAKAGAALADIGAPIRSATTISNEGTHDGAPAGFHNLKRGNPRRGPGRAIHGLVGHRSRGRQYGRPPVGRSPIYKPWWHVAAQRAYLTSIMSRPVLRLRARTGSMQSGLQSDRTDLYAQRGLRLHA